MILETRTVNGTILRRSIDKTFLSLRNTKAHKFIYTSSLVPINGDM